jgi:UDP-N-acetylmuramoyl-L-alanyl-D-glutamate--2,6-diaminopimelate ligase
VVGNLGSETQRAIAKLRTDVRQQLTDRLDDVSDGWTFVAVKGATVDGHEFVQRAVQAGAHSVIVTRGFDRSSLRDVSVIEVDDTKAQLPEIASAYYHFDPQSLDIYGVTGTNGKTTTTQLLAQMLQSPHRLVVTVGTLSGALTTPGAPELHRTINQLVRDAGQVGRRATLVMEVSSHALDQHRVDGLRFAVAGFTNLSQDHLDYHGTMEAYFQAKSLFFRPALSEMAVIFDDESTWSRRMVEASQVETTVIGWATIDKLEVGTTSSSFVWRDRAVVIPLGARFNVANALLAAEMAVAGGESLDDVADRFAGLIPVRGRLQRVEVGQTFDVVVDYAHTPVGLETILSQLRESAMPTQRLITVFGCGGDRDATKRAPMGAAVAQLSDIAVVTSDNPRSEDPLAIIQDVLKGMPTDDASLVTEVIPDRRSAIEFALRIARASDVVVIAGKGHERGQIVNGETLPFDDVEVVSEVLRSLSHESAS